MKLGRWIEEAACKGQTELFYPRQGDNSSFAKAAQICSTCPVLIECDEYAMTNYERFGIWAGMNEKKRRVARRMSHPTETMSSN
jgi:WhiB family redox-sensing transcriptional regulator